MHLDVPVGKPDTEFEVEVVVRPKAGGVVLPAGYFDLIGSVDDETLTVHPPPRLDCRQEPFGHHAEGLFCFKSSIPATSPGAAPSSKRCRVGRGNLRSTLQLLAAVGRLAIQTVIDGPLAGRLFSA